MRGRYSALSRPAICAAPALSVVAAKMGRGPLANFRAEIRDQLACQNAGAPAAVSRLLG
jgi:hypothetical protein